MNKLPAIAGVVLLIAARSLAHGADNLQLLFDDYWAAELRHDPFSATSAGVHDHNDRVPDVSEEAQQLRLQSLRGFMARLNDTDLERASESDRLSAEILRFVLKHDIALGQFRPWRIPFNSDSGFHTGIGFVVNSTRFHGAEDYELYLRRLEALPGYIDQNISNMREGLRDGFALPREIMDNIVPSFAAQVAESPEQHGLYRPFANMPASIDAATADAIRHRGARVLSTRVLPAYERLHRFIRDEYLAQSRKTLGASRLPDGSEYYAALVRYYTSLDDATAESIHARGLQEVRRIRTEMESTIRDSGFTGTFAEFTDFLRTDPQFYAKSADELLMRAAWIAKKTDGRLPALFGKLPRQPYSVEPVPDDIAPNYTGGRYASAPPGASRGGQYWVNTYALETRSLYQLVALSLHEGVPGHHLQKALAYEIEEGPAFREQFYPHAFGEGWGLYSEKLGIEMGLYETPYDHFGRLSYEMWRACRLVIDTGIHVKGWTRQQAVDYLASNTALSMHEVNTEIDRYIGWPGQALAYKMGELTILDLRAQSERELGDAFDVREFHDAVLAKGGLPLDMLRKQIHSYIELHRPQ